MVNLASECFVAKNVVFHSLWPKKIALWTRRGEMDPADSEPGLRVFSCKKAVLHNFAKNLSLYMKAPLIFPPRIPLRWPRPKPALGEKEAYAKRFRRFLVAPFLTNFVFLVSSPSVRFRSLSHKRIVVRTRRGEIDPADSESGLRTHCLKKYVFRNLWKKKSVLWTRRGGNRARRF